MDGTIDPARCREAVDNALVGNAEEIARLMIERFHPDERLMLWFDFFNHDCARIIADMQAFKDKVVPRVAERPSPRPPKWSPKCLNSTREPVSPSRRYSGTRA